MKSYETKTCDYHFRASVGIFTLLELEPSGAVSFPKQVNDNVSGIGICNFEFCTIKNH